MAKKTRYLMILFLALSLSNVVQAANTEYLELTMRGDDMVPAIMDGDRMKVKICTDGSLIKVGSQTSTAPGDIIIYCAGAIVPQPQSMFTCGRAISKRFDGERWFFKTKMDNSSEADLWEVPEYALVGVVVEVYHNTNTPPTPTTSNTDLQNGNSNPHFNTGIQSDNIPAFAINFALGTVLGLILGFAVKIGLSGASARAKGFHFRFPSSQLELRENLDRASVIKKSAFQHSFEVFFLREHS